MQVVLQFFVDILSISHIPFLLVLNLLAIACLAVVYVRSIPDETGKSTSQWTRYAKRGIIVLSGLLVLLIMVAAYQGIDDGEANVVQIIAGLFGLAISAAIAVASTSFVSNAMAGIMLRKVGNFGPGDFVEVGDHKGRVSKITLFHTEIQTPESDLVTLPSMYLVTNPVRVISSKGTVISATVSLGYDHGQRRIAALLVQAAEDAGLTKPFVQILELGDFSVTYRIAGTLEDTKSHLLGATSRLREMMLEILHSARIEIVSPSFMNQRQVDPTQAVLPSRLDENARISDGVQNSPDGAIFQKALLADRIDRLQEMISRLETEQEDGAQSESSDLRRKWRLDRLQRELNRATSEFEELDRSETSPQSSAND